MNFTSLYIYSRIMLTIALLVLPSPFVRAQTQDDRLKQLRVNYAMRFLEPAPHMELAKYYLDRGDRLLAFNILEEARRSWFEEPDFNRAFQLTFQGFDNSSPAEAALLKRIGENPQSAEAIFKLADLYISREAWPKAKQYLSAGIKIHPDDFKFTSGLAEVLRIQGDTQNASRLIKEFVNRYPESENSFAIRTEELIEHDPANAKSIATEARAKFPKSGGLAFDMGRILQSEGKLSEAEQLFAEAAALSPNSSVIQAWTGRFFFKVRNNKVRALDYYLSAYFLDPHAYETEHVESRIRNLSAELAEGEIERRTRSGTPLEKILNDSNPMIVAIALDKLSANWKPAYLGAALKCLDHDDGSVRWVAIEAIKKNTDRKFDAQLRALLADTDLRKRGLAAYVAVHLWQKESFGVIKRMLTEEAQLLRFDAVSALILEGGEEGRRIALDHAASEPSPTLKKLIELSKQRKTNEP